MVRGDRTCCSGGDEKCEEEWEHVYCSVCVLAEMQNARWSTSRRQGEEIMSIWKSSGRMTDG